MPSTYEIVANIISSLTDVPSEKIKLDSHVISDLEIDSLDFLDVIYEIDKKFDIQIPYEKWMEDINQEDAPTEKYFVVRNLCLHIDKFIAAKPA